MSAVLKEVVTQVKPVTELFSAVDFYTKTPDVVSEIKNRITIVNSIAFEVTENGKRSLKEYHSRFAHSDSQFIRFPRSALIKIRREA